jgi:hypothetical protein
VSQLRARRRPGLTACADICIAADAVFGFSEVRLGIIPGVISPMGLAKIGPAAARRYFLTGERFDARTALRIGLVDEVAADPDKAVASVVDSILAGGPTAVREAKRLVLEPGEEEDLLARAAERRASAEGQEGLRAFLDSRGGERVYPAWHPDRVRLVDHRVRAGLATRRAACEHSRARGTFLRSDQQQGEDTVDSDESLDELFASVLAVGMAVFATASGAADTAVPVNQSPPTLVGVAVEGGVLSAHHGRWQSDPPVSRTSGDAASLTELADVPGATDRIHPGHGRHRPHAARHETATNRDGPAAAPRPPPAWRPRSASGPQTPSRPPQVPVAGGRLVLRTVLDRHRRFAIRTSGALFATGGTATTSSARAYRPSSGREPTLRALVIASSAGSTALSAPLRGSRRRRPCAAEPLPSRVQGLAAGRRLSADRVAGRTPRAPTHSPGCAATAPQQLRAIPAPWLRLHRHPGTSGTPSGPGRRQNAAA